MTTDVDKLLQKLAQAPLSADMAGFEEAVWRKIAVQQASFPRSQIHLSIVTILGAALLGVASNGFEPVRETDGALAPFGASNPLAPSTLLASAR